MTEVVDEVVGFLFLLLSCQCFTCNRRRKGSRKHRKIQERKLQKREKMQEVTVKKHHPSLP